MTSTRLPAPLFGDVGRPPARAKKTSLAARDTRRVKNLNAVESAALVLLVRTHPGLRGQSPAVRELALLHARGLVADPQAGAPAALSASVVAGCEAAVARLREATKKRTGLRSSYVADGDAWAGAIRDAAGTIVWKCAHRHSNRDRNRRTSTGVVPAAKTCGQQGLAEVLVGTLVLS